MTIRILGVRIDNLKKNEILAKIAFFLTDGKQHLIFTPNPEMLVDASRDSHFQEILNAGDLNICDGRGIELMAKMKIERLAGVDLLLEICALAEKTGKTIYFLGSGDISGLEKLAKNIKSLHPNLAIAGYHPGPKLTLKKFGNSTVLNDDEEENKLVVNDIIRKSPDILFVAFGHPKQEKWISKNISRLPSIKIAMGVGGAFDYLSGKTRRAPRWVRRRGFEWLWRLGREPKRIGRIFKAIVVFPFLVIFKNKSSNKIV
ncbi:MAG: WecB/TagA/CpsF family glycosyltransferase [Patescibacteria group bacterium]